MVTYFETERYKFLVLAGIFAALGFLTKYSMAFLLGGIIFSVMISRRDIFKKRTLWIALSLLFLIILPDILWQVNRGFPVFHHFSKLYETQLDNNSRLDEIKSLVLSLNPFISVFCISGLLVVPFVPAFKKYIFSKL